MLNRTSWARLCLINLCIVAFLGLGLRSKILFPLPAINFRNLLSAHSHFAFAGWVGLALVMMLVYDLLPKAAASKKIYQWVLWGIEISSLGMAASFPAWGYNPVSIFFSTLYIVAILVFAPVFFKDIRRATLPPAVKLLSLSAIAALLLSFVGTIGLILILAGRSGNALLYRDSIYTFLHFQYNGFFTLGIFALFFQRLARQQLLTGKAALLFARTLCASLLPALFLSLLWHNNRYFYLLALVGALLILLSLWYFLALNRGLAKQATISSSLARTCWYFAAASFAIKMLLQVGTIIPQLGDAVYGDRPVIIGFLHLVFLGFVSFFLLGGFIEDGYFNRNTKLFRAGFIVFASGIFANEGLLMIQGLGVLLNSNSPVFTWLLWIAACLLLTGSVLLSISFGTKKEAMINMAS